MHTVMFYLGPLLNLLLVKMIGKELENVLISHLQPLRHHLTNTIVYGYNG